MIWVWFWFEGEHDGWALISLILAWPNRFEISLGLALMVWFRRCLGDLLAGFLGFWVGVFVLRVVWVSLVKGGCLFFLVVCLFLGVGFGSDICWFSVLGGFAIASCVWGFWLGVCCCAWVVGCFLCCGFGFDVLVCRLLCFVVNLRRFCDLWWFLQLPVGLVVLVG